MLIIFKEIIFIFELFVNLLFPQKNHFLLIPIVGVDQWINCYNFIKILDLNFFQSF